MTSKANVSTDAATHVDVDNDVRPAVIVAGDWIVDHYYFLKPNESSGASARGFAHYDIMSEPSDRIRDLCGAGHVAHMLYDATKSLRIFGLGVWNEVDTELFRHLVHADSSNRCPAARLGATAAPEWTRCATPPSNDDVSLETLAAAATTQRVIRTYDLRNGQFEQLSRLDIGVRDTPTATSLPSKLDIPPESVIAVVLHDMARGSVTKELVSFLARRYPKAPWYVRSKAMNSPWLRTIGDRVKFLLLGPELLVEQNALDTWALAGHLTPQAMTLLKSISIEGVVGLLTDKGELVARLAGGQTAAIVSVPVRVTAVSQLRWASAVFASVVTNQIHRSDPLNGPNLCKWMEKAVGTSGIPEIDVPHFMRRPLLATRDRARVFSDGSDRSQLTERSWTAEAAEWQKASQGHGTITDGSGCHRLDVWRGAPVLPGYITIVDERIQIVLRLARLLREFVNGGRSASPLSILLQSDPGTGKTALAEALAKAVGARLIRDDIARMTRREQVQDIFDAIAAVQSVEDGPIIVFIDEINALVEQSSVYSQFLGPLDQKPYARGGGAFQLRPCAWIFAGTHVPEAELTNADKFSDFRSRLFTKVEIDYASLMGRFSEPPEATEERKRALTKSRERVKTQMQLEQVYLGAARIGARFPHVSEISTEVLDVFYDFDPGSRSSPSRRISRLVGQIRSVHGGVVNQSNCQNWRELEDIVWSGRSGLVKMIW